MFFEIAVFAFEGNGVIQSLHNSMKTPEYFSQILKVLMAIVISVVVSVGTIAYSVSGSKYFKYIRVMEIKYQTW